MSSASIQFKCVKCGQAILVNRPRQPSVVVCPKCELSFAVMPDGEIIRQDRDNAFDNLPPAVVANYAPPRAKGFQATPMPASEVVPPPTESGQYFPPMNPPVHGQSSHGLKIALKILGLCAALCGAVLIASIAWYYVRDSRPREAITRAMATLDRPDTLMNDLVRHGEEIVNEIKVLESDQALDREALHARIVTNFNRISAECDSIFNRAKYIEPLSKRVWDYEVDNARSLLTLNSEKVKSGFSIEGLSPASVQSLEALQQNYAKAVHRVLLLAAPLPDGSDLKTTAARQSVVIERNLYVQACNAESDPGRNPDEFLVEIERPLAEATLAYHKLADQLAGRLSGEESISSTDELINQIRQYDYRNLLSNPSIQRTEIEKALAEARAEVLGSDQVPISSERTGD
jgi:DNA-directed RNA polymerase subunit RPC12/RpoP